MPLSEDMSYDGIRGPGVVKIKKGERPRLVAESNTLTKDVGDWEEEFDAKFKLTRVGIEVRRPDVKVAGLTRYEDDFSSIKSFIRTLLTKERQDAVDKAVQFIQESHPYAMREDGTMDMEVFHNQLNVARHAEGDKPKEV